MLKHDPKTWICVLCSPTTFSMFSESDARVAFNLVACPLVSKLTVCQFSVSSLTCSCSSVMVFFTRYLDLFTEQQKLYLLCHIRESCVLVLVSMKSKNDNYEHYKMLNSLKAFVNRKRSSRLIEALGMCY